MAEIVTLQAPIPKPSTTTVRIQRVVLDIDARTVSVEWLTNTGESASASYHSGTTPTGAQMLTQLNTTDLRTNSLVRRILTRLQTDGFIGAGAIGGTPD
jgi:hypothetical protein